MTNAEIVKQLIIHTKETKKYFLYEDYRDQKIWSNGMLLEIGDSFPPLLQKKLDRVQYDGTPMIEYVKNFEKQREADYVDAEIETPKDDIYYHFINASHELNIALDPILFNYANMRFPNANYQIKEKGEPVMVLDNQKLVMLIMPMKLSESETTDESD